MQYEYILDALDILGIDINEQTYCFQVSDQQEKDLIKFV